MDSILEGIETDLSEKSVNICASRVVTAGIDGTEEGIAIHQIESAEDLPPRFSIGIWKGNYRSQA
jgi:hypothetical protein